MFKSFNNLFQAYSESRLCFVLRCNVVIFLVGKASKLAAKHFEIAIKSVYIWFFCNNCPIITKYLQVYEVGLFRDISTNYGVDTCNNIKK